MSYPFLAAVFEAPLQAILLRWPKTLHAVTMKGVVAGWERGTFVAACGRSGLRLVPMKRDGVEAFAPWPPRVKGARGLPAGVERCRDCWVATGKPRPRVELRPK